MSGMGGSRMNLLGGGGGGGAKKQSAFVSSSSKKQSKIKQSSMAVESGSASCHGSSASSANAKTSIMGRWGNRFSTKIDHN
jgi:hypothetical protein